MPFLEKIGAANFVASFIPSLGFLLIFYTLFESIIPQSVRVNLPQNFDTMSRSALLTITLAVIIGYTLSSLNEFTMKLFQGYYFLDHFPWLRKRQQRKANAILAQITELNGILSIQSDPVDDERRKALNDRLWSLQTEMDLTYGRWEIMPTEFGNIIRAAEDYPAARYEIDKTVVWPRLLRVIPDDYYAKFEQTQTLLYLILNCTLLLWVLMLICLSASVIELFLFTFGESVTPNGMDTNLQLALVYLASGILAFISALVLHRVSVLNAKAYGNMVRSTFDLFRFDLLRQLKQELPADTEAEKQAWRVLCEYLAFVDSTKPQPVRLEYQFEDDKGDAKKE